MVDDLEMRIFAAEPVDVGRSAHPSVELFNQECQRLQARLVDSC